MTRTSWRWVAAVTMTLQLVLGAVWFFAPSQDAFGHGARTVSALVLVAVLGRWLMIWARRGSAGVRETFDRRSGSLPAFSEARFYYLTLLALWIAAGTGFAYYIAFVKG